MKVTYQFIKVAIYDKHLGVSFPNYYLFTTDWTIWVILKFLPTGLYNNQRWTVIPSLFNNDRTSKNTPKRNPTVSIFQLVYDCYAVPLSSAPPPIVITLLNRRMIELDYCIYRTLSWIPSVSDNPDSRKLPDDRIIEKKREHHYV